MASVKISELNTLLSISSDDFIPIVDSGSGTTYRVTFNVLNNWMAASASCFSASYALTSSYALYAEYALSSSYSITSSFSARALTASYVDISGFVPVNAESASYSSTSSCLQGRGTSWEQNLQLSSSLKMSGSSTLYIPRKRDIESEGATKNCIFFHAEYGTGSDPFTNDWTRIYFAEDTTDAGRMVFEHGDNLDVQLPAGPNIDLIGNSNPGFLWQTYQTDGPYATGSLMFLQTSGKLYLRAAEAREFSASVEANKVGFYGTSSYAQTASYIIGQSTAVAGTPPIGSVIDWPATADPVDSNWCVADGRELDRVAYATLFSVLGTTWGIGDGSTTFNIPNFQGKVTLGWNGGFSRISGSVGDSGGGEGINSHYHGIARTSYGWQSDGTSRNDDFGMWWSNYLSLNTLNQFPQILSPQGTYGRLYYVTGDSEGNDRVQPAVSTTSGTDGGWCAVSSFGLGPTSDMMPPYAVTKKIIRIQ